MSALLARACVCVYVATGLLVPSEAPVTEVMLANAEWRRPPRGPGAALEWFSAGFVAGRFPSRSPSGAGQRCLFPTPRPGIVVRVPRLVDP